MSSAPSARSSPRRWTIASLACELYCCFSISITGTLKSRSQVSQPVGNVLLSAVVRCHPRRYAGGWTPPPAAPPPARGCARPMTLASRLGWKGSAIGRSLPAQERQRPTLPKVCSPGSFRIRWSRLRRPCYEYSSTAEHATTAGIPTVRAWFYLNGTETPVADTPAKATPIPTEVFRTRSISVRKRGNPCRDHTAGPRDGGQDRPGWNVGCRSRSLDANPRDRPCCSGSARDAWKSSRRPHLLLRKPLHLGASLGDPSGSGTAHFLPRFRRDAASAPALRIPSPPLQVDESRPGLPRPTLRSDSTPLTGLLGSALEAFAMSLAAPQGRLLALQGNL